MSFLKCKLCGKEYDNSQMSDEHYPAKSVGNNDIVAFDIVKGLDYLTTDNNEIRKKMIESPDNVFDEELTKPLYPKGRTARTLCRECNTFLGNYDKAYLKFYNADGDPTKIKGYQQQTKINMIKAIYAKFLSIPEAVDEEFDFIEFIRKEKVMQYDGKWNLYFVMRDFSSDFLGFKDIDTGKMEFDEGIVYELSDDKFIFNLMNFEIHSCYRMTNMFDILNKDYELIKGVGKTGGYHAQIFQTKLLKQMNDN